MRAKTLYLLSLLLLAPLCLLANMEPEAAYQRLINGNKRFASDALRHPRSNSQRRESLTALQEPFATILCCSDSRVPPELVFDEGLGDLFVVRVAGNVCGALELDSIEYAALYLHSPLILVLGHENCGAVTAVLEGKTRDIEAIADLIRPALKGLQKSQKTSLEEAVKNNVKNVAAQLKKSPPLAQLIAKNQLIIKRGYYTLETGVVSWLD